MQKDFHFYVTYALARKAGFGVKDATKIAWADEYTDEQTEEEIYEIQTQCPEVGRWDDPQIQFTVLVPFHFVPGGEEDWPWKTTELKRNERAQALTEAAEQSGDLCRLGVALHAMQDTFSHQGFSGWREDRNSCYPWYYLKSALPNVGHAEMLALPDMVDRVWNDPRTNAKIDNRKRAMRAARATLDALARVNATPDPGQVFKDLKPKLAEIFRLSDYDERKKRLRKLSGEPDVDFAKTNKKAGKRRRSEFVAAACAHLSTALGTFDGLPRVEPS